MNDTARLAAHRELETEGTTTPAQSRSLPRSAAMDPTRFCTAASQSRTRFDADDHPRPWTYHKTHAFSWHVADAVGLVVATGLSQRDARIIASAPQIAALAHEFSKDVDAELTRVGL